MAKSPYYAFEHIGKELAKRPAGDALVTAFDAILLGSGFVHLNEVYDFPFTPFIPHRCIYYTVPQPSTTAPFKIPVLKFQKLGCFLIVYGGIDKGTEIQRTTYRVELNAIKIVPFLRAARVFQFVKISKILARTSRCKLEELWRNVNDDLVHPLLIDLYEGVGLKFPLSFMGLNDDLKLRILGFLNGESLAIVSCVSPSLRGLVNGGDLWEQRYKEEMFNRIKVSEMSYRIAYARAKEAKKSSAAPDDDDLIIHID